VTAGDQQPPAGARPRFGVEEEFFVVDPATRHVVPRAAVVLDGAATALGERVTGEITKFQVEARTSPCLDVGQLLSELAEARARLGVAAAAEGLRIMASGTPVLGVLVPQPVTDGPRQARGNAKYRGLHDELSICAMHVHVEMPDRERAVLVSNHLRQYLPTLISLAANSPYWPERDTGYASWRTMAWTRWPVAGPPPYFTSAAHYESTVATLIESGGLVDAGTIFWDLRPSARFPTLEVRVADVPVLARESALIAALVRALAVDAVARVDDGDHGPALPGELLRVAYWRAARDGLSGHGVDMRTGRLVPVPELVARLLEAARPVLEAYGELHQVSSWLRDLLRSGDGAARQRRAAARRGMLTDVVDHLIARTTAEEQPAENSTA
jgi:glutamate---cysteine ligase / carboxylate-amine ligase